MQHVYNDRYCNAYIPWCEHNSVCCQCDYHDLTRSLLAWIIERLKCNSCASLTKADALTTWRPEREWERACHIAVRTATSRAIMTGFVLSEFRCIQFASVVGSSGVLIISLGVQNGIEFCGQTRADFADGRVRVRRMANKQFVAVCICEHDRYPGSSMMIWG